MERWAAEWGVLLPDYPDFVAAGAAVVLVIFAGGIAIVAGRTIGPHLASALERRAGVAGEGLAPRICDLVRYLTASLILAVALKADAWPPLAALILGLGLALAVGRLVAELARGLNLPRWAAVLLAVVAFVAVMAEALG